MSKVKEALSDIDDITYKASCVISYLNTLDDEIYDLENKVNEYKEEIKDLEDQLQQVKTELLMTKSINETMEARCQILEELLKEYGFDVP